MKDGYKKVFWGLFIATFNIRLGIITIFPAFVGWIIVSSGLTDFNEKSLSGDFSRVKTKAMILIVLTIFGSLISIFGGQEIGSSILFSFSPILVMSIELSLFHGLIEASVHNFQALGLTNVVKKYQEKDRTYIILMGLTMALNILALSIIHGAVIFAAALLGISTQIYMLTVISSMGKENIEDKR